jgi:Tetratricopeptide repeat
MASAMSRSLRSVKALPSGTAVALPARREVALKKLGHVLFMLALGPASAFGGDLPSSSVCDPGRVAPRSWQLVTRAQALNVLRPRHDWWDSFDLGKYADDLDDLNTAATHLAQRALEVDPGNALAWGELARLYLIDEDPERAEEAWSRALAAGVPVVWTGTLYDVDARTYHVLAFDRAGIRIYRLDQLGGPVERGFYGIPKFPSADNERFWAGLAGCLSDAGEPEASVPWSEVREIKAGNFVLWFKLARPIRVSSDRTHKAHTLDEVKVALHGRTGELEVYKPVGESAPALRGRGPASYQDLVRRTMVKFVDPERRIALPPSHPGVGW